jgi:hypothetical protein
MKSKCINHFKQPYMIVSLLFSIALACFVEHRVFYDPSALNDDIRNQFYWLGRIQNPQLFPNDYIADYFTQPLLVSPLVYGLYHSLAPIIAPLQLSQILPLLLVMIASLFLYRFCVRYQDEVYAFWVCYCFNVSIWLMKNLAGGLPRAFMYPLLFCLFWGIQTRRWVVVIINLWVSALIYPPGFLLGLVTFLIEIYRNRHASGALAMLRSLGWTLIGLIPILIWRLGFNAHVTEFGPLFTANGAEKLRDFYFGGRVVLYSLPYQFQASSFPSDMLLGFLKRFPHLYIVIPVLIFGILLFLYKKYLRPRVAGFSTPPVVKASLLASGTLYVLAWVCLFSLYVPERYLEYTLFMMPAFILGGFITMLIRKYPQKKLSIAIGFIVISLFTSHFFWRDDLMEIPQREHLLYSVLKKLPADAMIAAPPGLANNIPLYAEKSVFLSNEAYVPFHRNYFLTMKARLKDWLIAYYATDSRSVVALIQKYGINYIIVQPADFDASHLKRIPQKAYFAFDDSFFMTLKEADLRSYYLLKVPSTCLLYKTKDFRVIDTKKCWPASSF